MTRMAHLAGVPLALVIFTAGAAELDCSGTLTTLNETKLSMQHIVLIDEPHATIKTISPHGDAYGKVEASQEAYKGYVAAEKGPTYWLFLNRYTGLLVLMEGEKITYSGECRPTSRRF